MNNDHRIRLRAAWDLQPGRVDLPTVWPDDAPRRFRLVRAFGHPPVDPARQTVWLELADVPGLVAATLDGARFDPTGDEVWSIALEDRPRHRLELEVDLVGVETGLWGTVALVVTDRDP